MPRVPVPEYGHYEMLSPERQRFVQEYLIDLNGRAAALRAGYQYAQESWRLLNDSDVQAAIRELQEKAATERHVSGAEFVLGKLWDVVGADPRELVEVHHVPCRYCWGINGQYQFTQTEYDRIEKAWRLGQSKKPLETLWPRGNAEAAYYAAGFNDMPLDEQGGSGYTHNREPNDKCSECHGSGIVKQWVADTRKLSYAARQLYRGAKQTGKGFEVLLADQDAARDLLARHYTVGVERKAILVGHIDPRQLSDDELIRANVQMEATLTEMKLARDQEQVKIGEQQRAVTNRHSRQVAAAKMRMGKTGQHMVPRPKG